MKIEIKILKNYPLIYDKSTLIINLKDSLLPDFETYPNVLKEYIHIIKKIVKSDDVRRIIIIDKNDFGKNIKELLRDL